MMETNQETANIKIVTILVQDDINYNESSECQDEVIRNKINDIIDMNGVMTATAIHASFQPCNENDYIHIMMSKTSMTNFTSDNKRMKPLSEAILKYIRVQDRMTQLTSTLLKSWLYYFYFRLYTLGQSHDKALVDIIDNAPIATLPRTKYNRPFIELEIRKDNNNHDEGVNNDKIISLSLPFSISHQHPITALSFISIEPTFLCSPYLQQQLNVHNKSNKVQKVLLPLLGMDVVIFDSSKLRCTIDEYLQCFQDSFSSWEWEQKIQHNNNNNNNNNNKIITTDKVKLIEFYLRWSMKESYTKALGVGMGKKFNSFESHLVGVDIQEEENKNMTADVHTHDGRLLWDCILDKIKQNNTNVAYFSAYLYEIDEATKQIINRDDSWGFYFLPISSQQNTSATNADHNCIGSAFIGCLCACVKSSNDDNLMHGLSNNPNEMLKYFSSMNVPFQDLLTHNKIN